MPATILCTFSQAVSAQMQPAILRAAATWGQQIHSNLPIRAFVTSLPVPAPLIAMCLPSASINFTNGMPNTWYVSALAEKLADQALLAQNIHHFAVLVSSTVSNWWPGPAQPPANQIDLESVVLHEMGHGLGFIGLFWRALNSVLGSYGADAILGVPAIQGLNLQIQLPHALNGHPSSFGRMIQDQQSVLLTAMQSPSAALGTALIGGNLRLSINAGGYANNAQYPIYAPGQFEVFRTCDHLARNDSLMQPDTPRGVMRRTIDPATSSVMTALGW
jgi:hypothetical protein